MTRRSNHTDARSDGEAAGGSMDVIELTRQVGVPRPVSEGRCHRSRPSELGPYFHAPLRSGFDFRSALLCNAHAAPRLDFLLLSAAERLRAGSPVT